MKPDISLGLKVDLTINPGRDRQGAQMRALSATARKRIEGILTVHVKGLKIIPIEKLPPTGLPAAATAQAGRHPQLAAPTRQPHDGRNYQD